MSSKRDMYHLQSILLRLWSCVAVVKLVDGVNAVDNTSRLLDELLEGYDRRLRPGFGGGPTVVDVNINIRSMGPISDNDMAYQMDCYFRQSWVDTRLEFSNSPLDILPVSVNILQRIWKPDTSFFNGRQSYLHTVTTPNKLLRINSTGRILYSMRISVKASCPMHLENFPMDTQTCPLTVGSNGYSSDELVYLWTHGNNASIEMSPDLTLSQFDLVRIPADTATTSKVGGQSFSTLKAHFVLRRHMGYFLINVYVPCSLLVIISWVGFWINREATADRVALGVMTVLTMAFLGIENRRDLPRVSYSTALDYFVGICFAFVLATILQFASVHFFTKHGSGEVYIVPENTSDEDDDSETDEADQEEERYTRKRRSLRVKVSHLHHMNGSTAANCATIPSNPQHKTEDERNSRSYHSTDQYAPRYNRKRNPPYTNNQPYVHESLLYKMWNCLKGSAEYRTMKLMRSGEGINSVSQLDKVSRVLFPIAFLIFNVVYWVSYLETGETTGMHL